MVEVQVMCFAASYAVALVCEFSRVVVRSGTGHRTVIALFTVAGLVAHTWYLADLAATQPNRPLSSAYDWYLVASWALVAFYLYLSYSHPRMPAGVVILPLALGLVGVARFFAQRTPFPSTEAAQWWGVVHGGLLLLGSVAVVVGFAGGVTYLWAAWRLKHKLPPPRGFELPSLEWLQKQNTRAIVASLILLGLGLLSGVLLNAISHHRNLDDLVPWNDPVVLIWSVMVAWMLTVAIFNAVYRPARQGRKVAYLAIASFVLLSIALGVKLFVETEHAPAAQNPAVSRKPAFDDAGLSPFASRKDALWQRDVLSRSESRLCTLASAKGTFGPLDSGGRG